MNRNQHDPMDYILNQWGMLRQIYPSSMYNDETLWEIFSANQFNADITSSYISGKSIQRIPYSNNHNHSIANMGVERQHDKKPLKKQVIKAGKTTWANLKKWKNKAVDYVNKKKNNFKGYVEDDELLDDNDDELDLSNINIDNNYKKYDPFPHTINSIDMVNHTKPPMSPFNNNQIEEEETDDDEEYEDESLSSSEEKEKNDYSIKPIEINNNNNKTEVDFLGI